MKLEQNYRSTGRIVRAALGVIERSRERVPKELWTANAEGAPIDVVATQDERDEAAHVVGAIQEARARGVDPKEIAVFYRVHAQSRVSKEALRAANMPYQIVGGTKFYERAEVKDALSYLRVLVNPQSDIDLLRDHQHPRRAASARRAIERLVALAQARGALAVTTRPRAHRRAARRASGEGAGLGATTVKLARCPRAPREAPRARSHTAPAARDLLARSSSGRGYRAALLAENTAESEARLENLAELKGSRRSTTSRRPRAAGEVAVARGVPRARLAPERRRRDEGRRRA